MSEKASTIQSEINTAYAKAYYTLEQAQISIGNCSSFAECIPVDNGLHMTVRSVMGVELPQITLDERNRYFYYGLNASNSLLDEAYINFEEEIGRDIGDYFKKYVNNFSYKVDINNIKSIVEEDVMNVIE